MHLSVTAPGSTTALVGDVTYAIVPVRGDSGARRPPESRCWPRSSSRAPTPPVWWASGPSVGSPPGWRARGRARTGRCGCCGRGGAVRRVACIGDVSFDALLIEFRDLMVAREDPLDGPVARLVAYDAKHKANLVETLGAWLDAFGNAVEAAEACYVHPNTFRYRLRRLAEVGDIDLADGDTRLSLMLQLRLLAER